VTASAEHYQAVLEDGPYDDESLTILVVTGATQQEVAGTLGVDLAVEPTQWPQAEDTATSDYAFADLDGGVLAIEISGYADPSLETLRVLSRGGRSAAVVRDNIQAHLRFGCARGGEIVFDDGDFLYLEDPERVPSELRALFATVWIDDANDAADGSDPVAVALAMAEVVTGLNLTVEDLERAADSGYRPSPSRVYPGN
jgi:hypothetical protein